MKLTANYNPDAECELRIDFTRDDRYPLFLPHYFALYDDYDRQFDLFTEINVWTTGEEKQEPKLVGSYPKFGTLEAIVLILMKENMDDWLIQSREPL